MQKIALTFFLLILLFIPYEGNYAQDKSSEDLGTSPLLLKERVRLKIPSEAGVRFASLGIKPESAGRLLLKENYKDKKVKEDRWVGWDKFGHFFVSVFLAGASYSIYHKNFNNDKESSVYFASILTLGAGVGKEVSDSRKPRNIFSYKDLIFDILGISAGLLIATN
jgi:uncharacterized protein YfiM (DUF2279 family)